MPNRLINETSPYLLQHAHNPVDWYPWGEEAFARAKAEDKPVLLSVGYSTCHWCHVMERESFEKELIARFMKEHFISIKVDREERPDIDHIYMEVLQATTGRGGWPMTVFLTPDREPFFCGTYFPPEEREGMPSFPRILKEAADAYANKRNETYATAKEIAEGLRRSLNTLPSPQPLSAETLDRGYKASIMGFDHQQGGFGFAPKFPQPMMLEFLLHYYRRTGQVKVLEMAEKALQRMADGGIHDQIGGGFHRYSVDHLWIVPHFEKMLYDNALLSQVYLHAYQVTRKDAYRKTAEDTLDYLLREMRDPSGGFYSAQDADSEGIEGKYYVWTAKEILDVLGPQEGKAFNAYFGVTDKGNFEGSNVLNIGEEVRAFLSRSTEASAQIQEVIERGKAQLLAARHKRVKPSCDDKMVTWLNGLAIHSFAEAASILGREDYRQAAVACANFVLRELLRGDALLHTHRQGKSSIPGFLDDYALLIRGLLALHEATLDQRWLESALQLADMMVSRFSDKNTTGLLYDTQGDQADLLTRPHDTFDSVKPSGASAAADVLLRLAVLTGKKNYEKLALAALSLVKSDMQANPIVHGNWLCALDFALSGPTEIAIIGNLTDPRTKDLLSKVFRRYLSNKVIVGMDPGQKSKVKSPLLQKRKALDGRPTVYLCYKNTCQAPTTDPSVLEKQLEGR